MADFIRKKIVELPKQLADKIAAGEVVERPLSIVKELVENSIDAGSDFITVEIKNGGKSYIRVTDNGCGIPKEEVELAFKRHATSKIEKIRDLDSIETLGFRGEALSSIAAVSRTELITKSPEEPVGTSVINEGGNILSVSDTGCPDGMTIVVRDLFYNTPARLKFLKKDNTESSLIIDFISKIALAYPQIRVRLINNGNTLFTTPGRGDRFLAIATVYDPHTAEKMIRIDDAEDDIFHLEGYISPPEHTRINRKNQIFFVNGRYVQSKVIERAVSDAYRQRLFEGRYPVVFLFLSVRPELLDVNIHPNKKEIRFDDEDRVSDFVTAAIKKGLNQKDAVGEITFRKDASEESPEKTAEMKKKTLSGSRNDEQQIDIRAILREKRAEQEYGADLTDKRISGPERFDPSDRNDLQDRSRFPSSAESASEEEVSYQIPSERSEASGMYKAQESADVIRAESEKSIFAPHIAPPEHIPFQISEIRPVGAIFAAYILGASDDTFYMIDQHAAHERIFYEKLTREFYGQQTASQTVALPLQIDVSHSVKNKEVEWLKFLQKIGFEDRRVWSEKLCGKSISYVHGFRRGGDISHRFL